MKLEQAKIIAEKYREALKPFCKRIEIAGSIRRNSQFVNDLELVVIRDTSKLFGLMDLVNQWEKVKGEPSGKYTQRILPEGFKLDLFFADENNWGNIFLIRTGSRNFSHKVAQEWVKQGYKSEGGILTKDGKKYLCKEEEDLFKLLKLKYVKPEERF